MPARRCLKMSIAKIKDYSHRIAEIVLVAGPAKGIVETRQQVIKLGRTKRDDVIDRNVKAAPD